MDIGEKIFALRKQKNLSQEALAEKVGVARQTISKWELGETAPDIKQAKELSKIFQVSLDELTGNDVKEVLIEKVSNTENLAGVTSCGFKSHHPHNPENLSFPGFFVLKIKCENIMPQVKVHQPYINEL